MDYQDVSARLTSDQGSDHQQTLNYRRLWDPFSADLDEWQIIGRSPGDLIRGRPGELFLADTENARVIHITSQGELISVIGRDGDGPGEFRSPRDLAYDLENDILWVCESGAGARITRFQRDGEQFEYLDRKVHRAFTGGGFPSLRLNDDSSFWTSWNRKAQSRIYGGELSRIQLFDLEGEILREFGEIKEPAANPALPLNIANVGFIEKCGSKRIAFLWMNRPDIEVWNTDGELLNERSFASRSFNRPVAERVSDDVTNVYPYFNTPPAFCPENGLLYLIVAGGEGIDPIQGLDPVTLETVERYTLQKPEDQETRYGMKKLIPVSEGETIRFFVLDDTNCSIVLLEPAGF
ncbi:hypothetical protein ACFL6R_00510 [Gemmatimonadota bacterium]